MKASQVPPAELVVLDSFSITIKREIYFMGLYFRTLRKKSGKIIIDYGEKCHKNKL
ncbi:MAG: hypothetical protein WCQ54_01450 [Clostridiaceae bacterium]